MKRLQKGICSSVLLATAACHATSSAQVAPPSPLSTANQLVVVTTTGWDSIGGELRRFARANARSPWQQVGSAVPIVVGKTGLAWGVGFDDVDGARTEPHKREGDGRSPAGIFPVGKAFGFAPSLKLQLDYVSLTDAIECVDDTASMHYNDVVDHNRVERVDWNSSEKMRKVPQYRLGAVIDYNAAPVKGRGSCIFFHIWGGPRSPTVGCTAMEASQLEQLLAWLDPRARPLVVQLPGDVYGRVMSRWQLPQRVR